MTTNDESNNINNDTIENDKALTFAKRLNEIGKSMNNERFDWHK